MALVTAKGVEVRVGNKRLLHDVDLRIKAGEIVTVIGPNGAGKSTLLKAIIGAVPISSGRIDKRAGLKIGYTPQKIQLEKTMPISVARFLSLAGSLPKGARSEVLDKTDVTRLRDAQMTDLSGGEFQRVLLARALLRKPDLLILDEPTQGLDQPAEARFYRLLAEVRKETGAAVLMVSHDLHVVMAQSDQVVCLNGHVCCSGAPAQVSVDPSYKELFGVRAELALYEHNHDHSHDHSHDHGEHSHD
jgi:zinc transport system ATP-binding protein